MTTLTFVLGTKWYQDVYGAGAGDPIRMTVEVHSVVSWWHAAHMVMGWHYEELVSLAHSKGLSIRDFPLEGAEGYIPGCYIDRPTIEADGKELLLEGKAPNRWLSREA